MLEFKKGSTANISKNFQFREFDCQGKGCCSTTVIDEKLVEYIQRIRDHFGRPITIKVMFRTGRHFGRR